MSYINFPGNESLTFPRMIELKVNKKKNIAQYNIIDNLIQTSDF